MSAPVEVPAPWERQKAESDEAWAAFRTYRDMPSDERRMTHSAAVGTARLSKWFRDHDWESRAKAYDAKFDQIRVEEREAIYRRKAREVAIDHMLIFADIRELVAREFHKYLTTSREGDMPGLIKPQQLTRLAETMVKVDRLVRGETTENVGTTALDYSKLSPDELDQLNELLDKATPAAPAEDGPAVH